MTSALRKGWCPSVLRPMASGDGLIVRLGDCANVLSPEKARALAGVARRCGNCLLDLTSRGHLQFRGVSEVTLAPLQAELGALGLIEPEEGPAAARSIMMSPLAGLDPAALFDSRPMVTSLRAHLLADPTMGQLPPKFCFGVDDGGRFSIAQERADICFAPVCRDDGELQFIISLAGVSAGQCTSDEVADAALRLAHVFLKMRAVDPANVRRMRDLLRHTEVREILQRAGVSRLVADTAAPEPPQPIGRFRIGERHALGIGVAFGRLDDSTLALLADVAGDCRGEIRLTPWRAVLIVGARKPSLDAVDETELILDSDDPLRSIAACPGAPRCASGTTATQTDARQLARVARDLHARGIIVHVSGCAKGCAYAAAAPVTFVGRNGLYDMVIEGRADQQPVRQNLCAAELPAALNDHIRDVSCASI